MRAIIPKPFTTLILVMIWSMSPWISKDYIANIKLSISKINEYSKVSQKYLK